MSLNKWKGTAQLILAGFLCVSMTVRAQETETEDQSRLAGNITAMVSKEPPEGIASYARYQMEGYVENYYISDDPAIQDRAGSSVYLGPAIMKFQKKEDGTLQYSSGYVFPVYHEGRILFTLDIFQLPDGSWHSSATNGPNATNQGLSPLEGQSGLYVLYTGKMTPPTVEKVEDSFHVGKEDTIYWLYPAPVKRNSTSFRLYNPNSGEHFYTQDKNEWRTLASLGWIQEGAGWFSALEGQAVYRLYNPNSGEHHYTGDLDEKKSLAKLGWKDEGISFFSDKEQKVPVYRLFNPKATNAGSHHYTTSRVEADTLVQNGWKEEGIGWYADLAGWTQEE